MLSTWYVLDEHHGYSFGENPWPTLGENLWYIFARKVTKVTVAHWFRAQQIVEDWRASAHRLLADLGENEEGRLEGRILSFLRACGAATVRDLYRALRSPRKPVIEALRALEEDGCVVRVELPPKPGVKSEAYRLADEPIVARS